MRNASASALLAFLVVATVPAAAQQRQCVFDAPRVITDEHHVIHELGDLDADGDVDGVGFWPETLTSSGGYTLSGKYGVWLNDGLGRMTLALDMPLTLAAPFLSQTDFAHGIGDMDADGRDDYVIASGSELRVFLSDGAQPPAVAAATSTIQVRAMCVADVTGDGRLDVVLASTGRVEVYEWDVASALPVLTLFATGAFNGGPLSLVAGELDGDGKTDFFVGAGPTVQMFEATTGSLRAIGTHSVPYGTGPMPMLVADDVDGDGDADVVDFGMGTYSVLRRVGPQAWQLEALATGGPATDLADVDGDGDLDGVCCGGGGTSTRFNTSVSYFRVALNDGAGAFAPAIEIPGVGSQHIAGVADLDADGDMDLVGGRCVYWAPSPITGPVMPRATDVAQDERTLADVDRDGDPDYVTGSGALAANAGDGSSTAWPNALPAPPAGASWFGAGYRGDFDGDDDLDLLVGLAESGVETLELLANAGGGSFQHRGRAMRAVPGSLDPHEVLVVDFDRDGDVDFVTQPQDANVGSDVYLNDGAGHFAFATTIPDRVKALADLDGDGDLDAIVTPFTFSPTAATHLHARLDLGGFAFGPAQVALFAEVLPSLDQIAVADLDGDGDVDLAAVHQTQLRMGTNDGAGNFVTTVLSAFDAYGSFGLHRHATALDADGDGRVDLVAGPVGSARTAVDVYLRKHDHSGWELPLRQTVFFLGVGSQIANVHGVADADGDGDPDLVGDRIVRNRAFIAATSGTRRQVGTSDAGAGGVRPTLGARGPFRSGATVELRVRGARPATSGRLLARIVEAPAPFAGPGWHPAHGAALVVPFTTDVGDGSDGSGAWTTSFVATSALVGRTTRYEVTLDDASGPGGSVRTNVLELVFGP